MPEIRALKSVTAPVTVQRGDLSVTLSARLEKINARDTQYSALVAEDVNLQVQIAEAQQEMQQQALTVAARVDPSASRFEQFRTELDGAFASARGALALADPDARESAMSEALGQALTLTAQMDEGTRPSAKTIEKREKELQKQADASQVKIQELNGQLRGARARRLIYLLTPPEGESSDLPPWDLTDGGQPWPLTEENLSGLSVELTEAMLGSVEKKCWVIR